MRKSLKTLSILVSSSLLLSNLSLAAEPISKPTLVNDAAKQVHPTMLLRAFDSSNHAYQFFAYNPYTNTPAKLVKYQTGNPYHSAIDWQVSLSLDNSRAIHVTAMEIKDSTIYLAGYFTGTLHQAFGGIKPKGKTAGFVVAVDAKDGKTLLWRKNLEVARRNAQATDP